MISNHALVGGAPRSERREDFATIIDEVLRLGRSRHFSIARGTLVTLCEDARVSSDGERAMCRALLALVCIALDDVSSARRLARRTISISARPFRSTPARELRWLRLARALAANASNLIGDVVRARRAAQAQFMANDPESAWLIGARVDPPWQEAPAAVQRYARFVSAVHEGYVVQPPSPLTPAEIEIFRHVATGASAVRIAVLLGRSPHTVRTHLRNAYAKLGAHDRTGALSKARALGLLNASVCRSTSPRG